MAIRVDNLSLTGEVGAQRRARDPGARRPFLAPGIKILMRGVGKLAERQCSTPRTRLCARRAASRWPALALMALIAAGCASQPVYPKQTITVLPPGAGVPDQPLSQAAISPAAPGEAPVAVPGEAPPSVPGELPRPVTPALPAPGAAAGQSHYNQGVMLFRQGNVDGAIQEFRLAIAENPRDVKARNNLGVLLEKTGDSHAAIQQYQMALQTDPNNKLTHRLLARALAESGDINGSIDQYEVAVKLDPNNAGVHNDFGVALHRNSDNRAAIYQYRRALALDPQDFAAHRNLADAYNETGNTTQAITELQTAAGLRPDDVAIHNALANLLFERNDLSGAMTQWQTASRLDPKNPDAMAGMSIGYWKMGQKRQALDSYRQAVALAPGYFCDDTQLRGQGHWNGPTLNALHDVATAPGAPPCSGT